MHVRVPFGAGNVATVGGDRPQFTPSTQPTTHARALPGWGRGFHFDGRRCLSFGVQRRGRLKRGSGAGGGGGAGAVHWKKGNNVQWWWTRGAVLQLGGRVVRFFNWVGGAGVNWLGGSSIGWAVPASVRNLCFRIQFYF